jgi:3-hydroxyacyl-[acyl-carrier-protein] dehydratase
MRLEYFDMIDRIDRMDRTHGEIEARSIVPDESPVFEGHFPRHPLVPGVMLTETMAQASGFLILALGNFEAMPFLMAIDRARFRAFVTPGTELAIHARIDREGSGYMATVATVSSSGKPLCDAALRFRLLPFPPGIKDELRARARTLGLLADAA